MKRIPQAIIAFLERQNFVLVSTVSKKGIINTVPKGIAVVQPKGKIYVVDLYYGKTWRHLKDDKNVTLCCIDERYFRGYQIKGIAKVYKVAKEHEVFISLWRKKVSARITNRLIENIRDGKKTHHHEAHFPPPKSIIEIEVREISSLTGKKT